MGGGKKDAIRRCPLPVAVYSGDSPHQFNTVGPFPPLSLRVLTHLSCPRTWQHLPTARARRCLKLYSPYLPTEVW
eukprot:scaffold133387_cov66-Phaeocystis_antarctica.AAC.2